MNQSTKGVTLYAGFLSDLLANYQQEKGAFIRPLFEMVQDMDLSSPTALVPIQRYNDMSQWIEEHLGPTNLRKAGEFVGARAYEYMLQSHIITPHASPKEILLALKQVVNVMVQDPLGRGWDILVIEDTRAVLRRTQTFHPVLQEGFLKSLIRRSGVQTVTVTYLKNIRKGDDFDEYEIKWFRTPPKP